VRCRTGCLHQHDDDVGLALDAYARQAIGFAVDNPVTIGLPILVKTPAPSPGAGDGVARRECRVRIPRVHARRDRCPWISQGGSNQCAALIDQLHRRSWRYASKSLGEAIRQQPRMTAAQESCGLPADDDAGSAQAITGRSQCTLPSPSMRLEKHERRNWWQAAPGASTR
jgi:hypothetical protein